MSYKFIPRYFILLDIINRIVFLISLGYSSFKMVIIIGVNTY
jgi:hypothetical protein